MPRGGVPGFAVVGYGKLGGKELGYGSDLDIVFLYDEARADEAEKLARIAQRVNSWLTTPHLGGRALRRRTCACGPTAPRVCS